MCLILNPTEECALSIVYASAANTDVAAKIVSTTDNNPKRKLLIKDLHYSKQHGRSGNAGNHT